MQRLGGSSGARGIPLVYGPEELGITAGVSQADHDIGV